MQILLHHHHHHHRRLMSSTKRKSRNRKLVKFFNDIYPWVWPERLDCHAIHSAAVSHRWRWFHFILYAISSFSRFNFPRYVLVIIKLYQRPLRTPRTLSSTILIDGDSSIPINSDLPDVRFFINHFSFPKAEIYCT